MRHSAEMLGRALGQVNEAKPQELQAAEWVKARLCVFSISMRDGLRTGKVISRPRSGNRSSLRQVFTNAFAVPVRSRDRQKQRRGDLSANNRPIQHFPEADFWPALLSTPGFRHPSRLHSLVISRALDST